MILVKGSLESPSKEKYPLRLLLTMNKFNLSKSVVLALAFKPTSSSEDESLECATYDVKIIKYQGFMWNGICRVK